MTSVNAERLAGKCVLHWVDVIRLPTVQSHPIGLVAVLDVMEGPGDVEWMYEIADQEDAHAPIAAGFAMLLQGEHYRLQKHVEGLSPDVRDLPGAVQLRRIVRMDVDLRAYLREQDRLYGPLFGYAS